MKPLCSTILILSIAVAVRADETLYRYEGDVHPLDPSAGWQEFNPCDPPCSEFLEDGHFVRLWSEAADFVNYDKRIAVPPTPPPNPLGRVAFPLQLPAGTYSDGLRRRLQRSLSVFHRPGVPHRRFSDQL